MDSAIFEEPLHHIIGHTTVPFENYIKLREPTLLNSVDLPPYLLLPEILHLLDATLDDKHRMLFEFIWHTGARITDALSVTPVNFVLDGVENSCVTFANSMRTKKDSIRNKPVTRTIPITDKTFIISLQRYIYSFGIKSQSPLFDYSRQAAHNAIEKSSDALDLPFRVSLSTLRHSFAVNHLLHGQQIQEIQYWLGHNSLGVTEVYLQIMDFCKPRLSGRTRFR